MILRRWASKKTAGSTKNGRDSKPKNLGVKKFGGEVSENVHYSKLDLLNHCHIIYIYIYITHCCLCNISSITRYFSFSRGLYLEISLFVREAPAFILGIMLELAKTTPSLLYKKEMSSLNVTNLVDANGCMSNPRMAI